MVDWVKDRGGSTRESKAQDRAKENHERNTPAMVRDGRELSVSFDAGNSTLVAHGLDRTPQGWFLHSYAGSPYAIVEISKTEREIRLQNVYAGAGALTAKLWIW